MVETQIVGEAVAGEAAALHRSLQGILKQLNRSSFDIAEILYKIKSKNKYNDLGFATFPEYVRSLDFKESKGDYLPKIVEKMVEAGIPREKYEPLGVSRMRSIARLDPKATWKNPSTGEETPVIDFIKGFMDTPNMPLKEVQEHVRVLTGQVGENDKVFRTFCFTRLVNDEVIEPKLELAKKHIGSVGRDITTGEAEDPSDSAAAEIVFAEFDPKEEDVEPIQTN